MGIKAVVGVVLIVGPILAGCGLVARKQHAEEVARVKAQVEAGLAECDAKYKKVKGQMLDRMRCRSASAVLYKPLLPYPDLLDQELSSLMVIAERVDKGQMSPVEGEQAASEVHSKMVAEEQRRMLANRSVSAQESAASAAWRASAPVTCTRSGNSTTCS